MFKNTQQRTESESKCVYFICDRYFIFLTFYIMGNLNTTRPTNRVITKEEVNKILIDISKYFYLSNFNITLTNKINSNWKIVVSYKVNWLKNWEKISINDNFII